MQQKYQLIMNNSKKGKKNWYKVHTKEHQKKKKNISLLKTPLPNSGTHSLISKYNNYVGDVADRKYEKDIQSHKASMRLMNV